MAKEGLSFPFSKMSGRGSSLNSKGVCLFPSSSEEGSPSGILKEDLRLRRSWFSALGGGSTVGRRTEDDDLPDQKDDDVGALMTSLTTPSWASAIEDGD